VVVLVQIQIQVTLIMPSLECLYRPQVLPLHWEHHQLRPALQLVLVVRE
jgi:hypothetical protein